MPGLLAASANEVVKFRVNVEGLAGAGAETPPENENDENGNFTAAVCVLTCVVAEDTAAVDTAKADTPASAKITMALVGDPSFLMGPPRRPPARIHAADEAISSGMLS